MTKIIGSVCPKCGTIGKFGKMSCCGRGGSWNGICGIRNSNLEHTWSEGIQACESRSQSKKGTDQQLSGSQQRNMNYSNGSDNTAVKTVVFPPVDMSTLPQSITPADSPFMSMPIDSISVITQMAAPPRTSPSMTQGCAKLLNAVVHIGCFLFVVVI